MARETERLSARHLSSKRTGMYADGGGLYLQVTKTGARSWLFCYMLNRKSREMGLGSLKDVSLAEARQLAVAARQLVRAGVDPIERRKQERAQQALADASAVTFQEAAEAYVSAHESGWRNEKHRQQWKNTLATYVYPLMGTLPISSICTEHIMRTLQRDVGDGKKLLRLWDAKPETASRVRMRIEAILDWARARGYREGENPARWKGHLDKLLPRPTKVRCVEHHAALPYSDVGEFVADLRQQKGTAARALEFTILAAARTGETLGARWDEIDLSAAVWTIPGSRMKGGREHRVPLSAPALVILKGQMQARADGEVYVFPSGRQGVPLSNMAMLKLLERMGYDVTVHGFRSTFRDWAAEVTSFPNHVVEMALSHAVGDKVESAYRRGDLFQKRRQLMDAWARYCAESRKRDGTVVVPMAAKA